MPSHDEIAGGIETQEVILGADAVSEAFKIKEVLNLAYEIHRSRGGLFGYDLEDWLEAERELAERKRPERSLVEEVAHAESLRGDQEGIENNALDS